MGFSRSRGPYAPVRQPAPTIDWAALEADHQKASAEQFRIEEEARRAAEKFRLESDPLQQLVRRCHEIEQRQDAFAEALERLREQQETIIELVKGADHASY